MRKKERKKERLQIKGPLQTNIKLLITIYKKLHHYYKILTFRIEKKMWEIYPNVLRLRRIDLNILRYVQLENGYK